MSYSTQFFCGTISLMIRNDAKVLLRQLWKDRSYTFVALVGLTLGLTVSLLITFYIRHERSYDAFHEHADRLYRISLSQSFQGAQVPVLPPGPLGPALEAGRSSVQRAVRVRFSEHPVYVSRDQREPVREPKMSFADASLFEVFEFSLQRGNPETALAQPYTLVLSPEAAARYFGDEDPIGQRLTIDGGATYTVTGVLARPPGPSHLSFDLLASYPTLPELGVDTETWTLGHNSLYILAAPPCGAPCLERIVSEQVSGAVEAGDLSVIPEPITSVHLYGQSTSRQPLTGDVRYLWLLGTIAVLVLLTACVNYTNLATARSLRRGTEIGVHKTLGAGRRRLALRHLAESTGLCLVALVLAGALAAVLLPWFGDLLGVSFRHRGDLWTVIGAFGGVALVTGLLAGAYPAVYLARFQPANVLGGSRSSAAPGSLRTVLVVVQVAVSVAFLAGAFGIYDQLEYLQNRDLGFDASRLIVVDASPPVQSDYATLKNQWEQLSGVEDVTRAPMPGHTHVPTVSVKPEGWAGDDFVWVPTFGVDPEFLSTTGVALKTGRGITPDDGTGAGGAVLVNEAAVDRFGWEQAVGKRIEIPVGGQLVRKRVVGVVEDFHYGSLKQSIKPVVIHRTAEPGGFSNVLVRINASNVARTVDRLNEVWSRIAPSVPFTYRFMDRQFESYYRAEQRIGTVVSVAAGLTVLIVALGLFGLAAFTVQRRRREIGIRKTLGATISQVIGLFTKQFLGRVAIGTAVALPVGYWVVHQWLDGFAYRASIGAAVLLGPVALTVVVTLVTLSYHALQAARVDPAVTLRDE